MRLSRSPCAPQEQEFPASTSNSDANDTEDVNSNSGDGLDWLTQVASGSKSNKPKEPAAPASPRDPPAASGANIANASCEEDGIITPGERVEGLEWLSAAASVRSKGAKSTEQRKRSSARAGTKMSAPGGWLLAALGTSNAPSNGVSSEAGEAGEASTGARDSKQSNPRQGKKTSPRTAVSRATVPNKRSSASKSGGWLATAVTLGRLGVPGAENDGEDADRLEGSSSLLTVEMATQTEEDCGKAIEPVSRDTGGKLPPWAKPWTPPVVEVMEVAPPSHGNTKSSVVDERPQVDASSSRGLDWMHEAVKNARVMTREGDG